MLKNRFETLGLGISSMQKISKSKICMVSILITEKIMILYMYSEITYKCGNGEEMLMYVSKCVRGPGPRGGEEGISPTSFSGY